MYARMLLVKLEANPQETMHDLANRWHAAVSTLPGFIRVDFLFDEKAEEHGYISYWESLEQAVEAGEKIGAQLPRALANITTTTPHVRYFEVYEPAH